VRTELVAMMVEDVESGRQGTASEAPKRLHRVVYALTRGWGVDAERDLKLLHGHPDVRLRDTLNHALSKVRGAGR
jgi:hypothetical protein